jgi:hypothetical protein
MHKAHNFTAHEQWPHSDLHRLRHKTLHISMARDVKAELVGILTVNIPTSSKASAARAMYYVLSSELWCNRTCLPILGTHHVSAVCLRAA